MEKKKNHSGYLLKWKLEICKSKVKKYTFNHFLKNIPNVTDPINYMLWAVTLACSVASAWISFEDVVLEEKHSRLGKVFSLNAECISHLSFLFNTWGIFFFLFQSKSNTSFM